MGGRALAVHDGDDAIIASLELNRQLFVHLVELPSSYSIAAIFASQEWPTDISSESMLGLRVSTVEVGLLRLHSSAVEEKLQLHRHRGPQLHFSAARSVAATVIELVTGPSAIVGSASLEQLAHLGHNPKVVQAG